MNSVSEGWLGVVLHAHTPYVRASEDQHPHSLDWFCEAMGECYLPLLMMLDQLESEGVRAALTLAISPCLLAMMDDEGHRSRLDAHLRRRMAGAEAAYVRSRPQSPVRQLAEWYRALYALRIEAFNDDYERNLASAFAGHHQRRRIELITSAGTHPVLPLLADPAYQALHIDLAVDTFVQRFGFAPQGMWLPDCGFQPGIDLLLARRGVRYTVVEAQSLAHADRRYPTALHTPVAADSGVVFFGRDPAPLAQIADPAGGVSPHSFYRRAPRGQLPDLSDGRPYLALSGHPEVTESLPLRWAGFIGEQPTLYDPALARARAENAAEGFVQARRTQVYQLLERIQRPPIVVLACAAERFGCQWFEGLWFLEALIRSASGGDVSLCLPTEYLDRDPIFPVSMPSAGSSGTSGYWEDWVDDGTEWVHRRLITGSESLLSLCRQSNKNGHLPLRDRALDQALRELLLAQSGDWVRMLSAGRSVSYALDRLRDHMDAVARLSHMVASDGRIDEEYLTHREERWGRFPEVGFRALRRAV